MKRLRRKPIKIPEKYEPTVRKLLLGDHRTAKTAKKSLVMAANNSKNPEEARLLKQVYRRIKL